MVCRSCPVKPLHPGILLELLPNVRSSCFLMRSSYHRPICMSTDNMCIFYTFVPFYKFKMQYLYSFTKFISIISCKKFQFHTIYVIFLMIRYIKHVFATHIVLPMTYCDPPRNVKMPELFTLRHFSYQFLLYFRLQNRSPALHQPYRQYNLLGDRLILQTLRNIFHAQFCHFFHRLMDRRDLGCCYR